jgi:hypothetical protein
MSDRTDVRVHPGQTVEVCFPDGRRVFRAGDLIAGVQVSLADKWVAAGRAFRVKAL